MTPIFFGGSKESVKEICDAVRKGGLVGRDLCFGSIKAIGLNFGDAFSEVQNAYPLYLFYIPLFFVALIPFIYSKVFNIGSIRYLMIIFGFIPLFTISDYGRWIAMITISLLIVMLATGDFEINKKLNSPPFAVFFVLGWGVPFWFPANGPFPLVGALPTLFDFIRRALNV
jgi:hypothetical protein